MTNELEIIPEISALFMSFVGIGAIGFGVLLFAFIVPHFLDGLFDD